MGRIDGEQEEKFIHHHRELLKDSGTGYSALMVMHKLPES